MFFIFANFYERLILVFNKIISLLIFMLKSITKKLVYQNINKRDKQSKYIDENKVNLQVKN